MTRFQLVPAGLWGREISPFQSFFDGFFGEESRPLVESHETLRAPHMNLSETDKEFILKAELPGVDPKDIDVSLERNTLVVKGERRAESEDKNEGFHRREIQYGSFYRTVRLPTKVDAEKVHAEFKNGILAVRVAKATEVQKESRKITVST